MYIYISYVMFIYNTMNPIVEYERFNRILEVRGYIWTSRILSTPGWLYRDHPRWGWTMKPPTCIYMVVDQNSSIPERPFFANKNFTFAKLSRTPCLSFAGPMLANNTSYEDSFTTCQITPENHGSLLGSLLNMQLASRNPFSGQICFAKFTGPPPSTCTLTFARSFA